MNFTEITNSNVEQFRLIYHQTTNYSNPIIESLLYDKKVRGIGYYWGDILDANYMLFHESGFSHLNVNPFHNYNFKLCEIVDLFIVSNTKIPDYLMFYNAPEIFQSYWISVNKPHFKKRVRKRYQIDENHFKSLDKEQYSIPKDHELIPLINSEDYLDVFGDSVWNKFYESKNAFLDKSFGFILLNNDKKPVAIAYLLSKTGLNGECSLITLPEYRKKGYGFILITNYIAESIKRKVNVGWDCFIDNYTNEWVKIYGYTHIIREYQFVTFLKKAQ